MGRVIRIAEINGQGSSLSGQVSMQDANLSGMISAIENYTSDEGLDGNAWNANKNFFVEVHTVVLDMMKLANKILVDAHNSFAGSVGGEDLDEEELKRDQALYKNLVDTYWNQYAYWSAQAALALGTGVFGYRDASVAVSNASSAWEHWHTNNELLDKIEQKIDKLNEIDMATASMFDYAKEMQLSLGRAITEINGAWKTNGFNSNLVGCGWFKRMKAQCYYAEAVQYGVIKIDEAGVITYQWDVIENLMQMDATEVTEAEYMALIQAYDSMVLLEDMEKYIACGYIHTIESVESRRLAQKSPGANGARYILSQVFCIASEKYSQDTDLILQQEILENNKLSSKTIVNLDKVTILQNVQLWGSVINRSYEEQLEKQNQSIYEWINPISLMKNDIGGYTIKIHLDDVDTEDNLSVDYNIIQGPNMRGDYLAVLIDEWKDEYDKEQIRTETDVLFGGMKNIISLALPPVIEVILLADVEGTNEKEINAQLELSEFKNYIKFLDVGANISYSKDGDGILVSNIYVDEEKLKEILSVSNNELIFRYNNAVVQPEDLKKALEEGDKDFIYSFNDWYKKVYVFGGYE